MNRQDFQNLALIRLREAEALLQAGLSDGAYYLSGYVVECGLKACIAKMTQQYDFPDKKRTEQSITHEYGKLVSAADLKLSLEAKVQQDAEFSTNWDTVLNWTETSRYVTHDQAKAQQMVNAVSDPVSGVLAWIQSCW